MRPTEKLERDIDALRDAIRQGWLDIAALSLDAADRKAVRERIRACAAELWEIDKRLD